MTNPDTDIDKRKNEFAQILKNYVPESAAMLCAELIIHYRLHLHIETERKTKYGDYSPHLGKGNRISINHNLPKFEFLFTFIHELAHHTTYLKFGPKHKAHGEEWKQEFKNCIKPFLLHDIFPNDLKSAIIKHMQNPKYSHSADVNLLRAFRIYNDKTNHLVLDNLKEGSLFKMKNSDVIMQKKHKLRTYYYCVAINTNKAYKVHAMAEVIESKF
ncbi:MAG: SprT-like domain-containing protein [Bacteroidia bacterium]